MASALTCREPPSQWRDLKRTGHERDGQVTGFFQSNPQEASLDAALCLLWRHYSSMGWNMALSSPTIWSMGATESGSICGGSGVTAR